MANESESKIARDFFPSIARFGLSFLFLILGILLGPYSEPLGLILFALAAVSLFVTAKLECDLSQRTYRIVEGLFFWNRTRTGSTDDWQELRIGAIVDGRSGQQIETKSNLTIIWKNGWPRSRPITSGDFIEIAKLAAEISAATGVPVTETDQIRKSREQFSQAPYIAINASDTNEDNKS